MEKDLKWIKKHYGEEMMHLCRELFPRILETEDLLPSLLREHFPNNNRYLAADIKRQAHEYEFKEYIFSLVDVDNKPKILIQKSPVELMDKAGYILYPECKTEEDIQSFKKWYAKGEELCTFRGDRLNTCRVWFAVKKNADELKRENFTHPKREDPYGISVISIQFTKEREYQSLSIKNRYNHTVNNPDNTFNSNLDKIIQGLASAFERDYGVRDVYHERKINFELKNYVCVKGKFYHYNVERNNIYYCDGGVIIDNFEVKKLPEHQMLMDYFIVDFKEKKISLYDETFKDSFCKSFGEINQMSLKNGTLIVSEVNGNEIEIGVSPRNEIVSYKNKNLKRMDKGFLTYNERLEELYTPKLQSMDRNCFLANKAMTKLNLPELESMGESCFELNELISEINLPKLKTMDGCFYYDMVLTELHLPELESMGDGCFYNNRIATKLDLPKLKTMGDGCFSNNEQMVNLDLPKLESMGDGCFYNNNAMAKINLPKLKKMSYDCFYLNKVMTDINAPELESIGDGCFSYNKQITELSLPKLKIMGNDCFHCNKVMTGINTPELESMGEGCFTRNEQMTELNLPELQSMGKDCFYYSKPMVAINAPKLKSMGNSCFAINKEITKLNLPELQRMGEDCFYCNEIMTEINAPELESMGEGCFFNNEQIEKLNMPKLKKLGKNCFSKLNFKNNYLQQTQEME